MPQRKRQDLEDIVDDEENIGGAEEDQEEQHHDEEEDESEEDSDDNSDGDEEDSDEGKSGESDDDASEDDERHGQADEEEDDGSAGGEDEEAIKAARRKARREKKQRAKEAREADKRLISTLQQRLDQLEGRQQLLDRRGNQHEMAQIDHAISQHQAAIQEADKAITKAIEAKNGNAFTAAQNARDELRERLNRLNGVKQAMVKASKPQGSGSQPAMDPRIVSKAQAFAKQHSWYDATGKDVDSRIVMSLDEDLHSSGFDPSTDDYWKELRARVKRYLPHRFEASTRKSSTREDQAPRGKPKLKGKPPAGSSKTRSLQPPGGVQLSKERRQAMIESGLQPGTKEWNDQVKSYASWDKRNRAS